ncbi:hypothetical protein THAOC_01376 [Thalassiosira oceanica]|uniref:Uncharacterized protein n=1 Tax=Thalassiosira oceanica TaxID=159749 RepID=K0THD9_THAOC|nr:hypothetical protein THAOC_01376 [Thalassiosira oceanica]|eukprot:EJK76840.1 hypothetical protein THAOC_01376 [Thalassiosira oceanica]
MSNSTCPNAPLVPVVSGGVTDGYDDSDATSQRQQQLVPLVSGTQGDGGPGLNADAHSSSCGRADQGSFDSAAVGSTDLSLATATDSKSKKPGRKRKQKRGRKKKDAQTAPGEAVVAPNSEARGPNGKAKPTQGRPRKSGRDHPVKEEEQASAQARRILPNRDLKVKDEVTSIEVGAKDYSRSTGCRESEPSMYDIDYRKVKRASQQERASPTEVEVGASQLLPSNQLSEAAAGRNIDGSAEHASQSSNPPPSITNPSGLPESSSKSVRFSLGRNAICDSQPTIKRPRLSEGCIPDATPIKLSYGNDFYGYDALYSGWMKNGEPNGPGTLRFNGVVLKGGFGDQKYDVIIKGTFSEGLLTHGRESTASGVFLYKGDYECWEADGEVSFCRHGSGKLSEKWYEPENCMEYHGQFRNDNMDGQGKMTMNGDVFEGTFYPSLCDVQYLIPFAGTRKLPDGSTQHGNFILNGGYCFKVVDICFESGMVLFLRDDGSRCSEISIDDVFKGGHSTENIIDDLIEGNREGVPDEWRDTFELLECVRLRRLSNPDATFSGEDSANSFDAYSVARSCLDYFDAFLRIYKSLRAKSDELNLIEILKVDDDIEAFKKDCESNSLARTCSIVTNMDMKCADFFNYLRYSGTVSEELMCTYDGTIGEDLYQMCGHGTITYAQNVDGYQQYEGSLDEGWLGQGTLTLTDGTKYSGEFLELDYNWICGTKYEKMDHKHVEMYGFLGRMCKSFVGKCILPIGGTREGFFRLVDPEKTDVLRSHEGEALLREGWEQSSEGGFHNLQFEEWVEHHSLWLNELKVQSTTPLVLRDKDDKRDDDCEEGSNT